METSFIQTWQFPPKAVQRKISTPWLFEGTLKKPLFPKSLTKKCCLQRKEQGKMPFHGHSPAYENLARLFEARFFISRTEQI
jgi:hypothetical protein